MQPEQIKDLLTFIDRWNRWKNLDRNPTNYPTSQIAALREGKDVEKNYKEVISFLATYSGSKHLNPPMIFAAGHGDHSIVKALIAHCPKDKLNELVNSKDTLEWTPLQLAANKGHFEIVIRLLSSQHVDINIHYGKVPPALYLAAAQNHIGIIIELLAYGAKPELDNYSLSSLANHSDNALISQILDVHSRRNSKSHLATAVMLGYHDLATAIKKIYANLFYAEAIGSASSEMDSLRHQYEYPEQVLVYNHLITLVDSEQDKTQKLSMLKRAIEKDDKGNPTNAMSQFMHSSWTIRTILLDKVNKLQNEIDRNRPLPLTQEGTHTNNCLILSTAETFKKKPTINAKVWLSIPARLL